MNRRGHSQVEALRTTGTASSGGMANENLQDFQMNACLWQNDKSLTVALGNYTSDVHLETSLGVTYTTIWNENDFPNSCYVYKPVCFAENAVLKHTRKGNAFFFLVQFLFNLK